MRLLYSKYPLPGGLVVVNFYQKLFREAIGLRNRIVAYEYSFALNGFEGTTDMLSADIINEKKLATPFYFKYIQPLLMPSSIHFITFHPSKRPTMSA